MSAKFLKLKRGSRQDIFSRAPGDSSPTGGRAPVIDLAPGALIGGVYKIIKMVGQGGMGEVYLATHETLAKKCALKVIPPDKVTEIGWKRFQQEARAVAKLEHINLVKVTDLGIHDNCLPFYAMDYVDGQNLSEVLSQKGTLSLATTLEIFTQVCEGVECAHRSGILHRDLKPANLMLTRAANGKLLVKVLDFGLAKLTKQDRTRQSLTAVGDVFGSPYYMSPEQCEGDNIDQRSDVYSMGCAMFECLTGRPPFEGNKTAAIIFSQLESKPPTLESIVGAGKFPASMEVVMANLLRKKPEERYQSMTQVKADLARVAAGKEVLPVVGGRSGPLSKAKKVLPEKALAVSESPQGAILPLVLSFGLLFLILVGGTFYWYLTKTTKKQLLSTIHVTNSEGLVGPSMPGDEKIEKENMQFSDTQPLLEFASEAPPVVRFWDKKPFCRGVENVGGIPCRRWSFPSDMISPLKLRYEEGHKLVTRRLSGDVYVPVDSPLCLVLLPEMTRMPKYLDALVDGTFDELDLRQHPEIVFALMADKFGKFKSVTGLQIGNVTWSLNDCRASLFPLSKFSHLQRLRLDCVFDGPPLTALFKQNKLQALVMHLGSHDCMLAISQAKGLRSLAVLVCMNHLADTALIAANTGLERVMVGQLTGTQSELRDFSRMPSLHYLDLPELSYRPTLAAEMRSLRALKTLKFMKGPGGYWTPEHLRELARALPGVKIITYESIEEGEAGLFRN
ncbi:MAG: serine/threonine protein kinase [Cyanobacteria bacterium SZAS LIN-2]|nr:serine/threonine protein kinase [Cyanobacteria bacterium SZAS LIN-2]